MLVPFLLEMCKHLDSKLSWMTADNNQYDTHVAIRLAHYEIKKIEHITFFANASVNFSATSMDLQNKGCWA